MIFVWVPLGNFAFVMLAVLGACCVPTVVMQPGTLAVWQCLLVAQ